MVTYHSERTDSKINDLRTKVKVIHHCWRNEEATASGLECMASEERHAQQVQVLMKPLNSG